MKKTSFLGIASAFASAVVFFTSNVQQAHADLYNQNITAIFGAGNPDTGWTFDDGLALRFKDRSTGDTLNINGVYTSAGGSYAGAERFRRNLEFSIQASGPVALSGEYYLLTTGPSYPSLTLNVLTQWTDNSYGDASTSNGAGVEGDVGTYGSLWSKVQNSQNFVFWPWGQSSLVEGVRTATLYKTALGAGPDGERLAQVDAVYVVGVPEPTSAALLGIGALAVITRRRSRS